MTYEQLQWRLSDRDTHYVRCALALSELHRARFRKSKVDPRMGIAGQGNIKGKRSFLRETKFHLVHSNRMELLRWQDAGNLL